MTAKLILFKEKSIKNITMKTKLFTCAFLLAALAITAQNNDTKEKKEATVRIKKVENINGVEKVTDTTYTVSDPDIIISGDHIQHIKIKDSPDESGYEYKTVIIDDKDGKGEPQIEVRTGDPKRDAEIEKQLREAHKSAKGGKMHKVIVMDENGKETKSEVKVFSGEGQDAEIEKALKEAGVDSNTKGVKKMIIVDEDTAPDKDGKNQKTTTKIVIIKMDITDVSADDKKRLSSQIGNADNKLEMDNMKMYPNPNDGKFNLNFNLKNKADAEVTVYDMQGKQVYSEKLPNFSGDYNKAIDISSNTKGVYFVKIQQGKHSQVKKIVMD